MKKKSIKPKLKKKGDGGLWDKDKVGYIDSVLNANKNLDFVKRLYEPNTPNIPTPLDAPNYKPGQHSTHLMGYDPNSARVYPSVVRTKDGKLQYLGNGDNAWDYADTNKEFLQFPDSNKAKWFADNYKQGTGVLKEKSFGGNISTSNEKWEILPEAGDGIITDPRTDSYYQNGGEIKIKPSLKKQDKWTIV